jgi:hypothetical protein
MLILVALFLVSVLISSCGLEEVCGNGVCEVSEKQLGTCPTDCLRIVPVSQLPDLTIETLIHSPENPMVGQEVSFSATIKNNGAEAGQLFFAWDVEGLTQVTNQYASKSTIDPGEEVTIYKTGTFDSAGNKQVSIVMDPFNTIIEGDESNNQVQEIIYISSGITLGDNCAFDTCNGQNPDNCLCGGNQATTSVQSYCCGSTGVVFQYEQLCQQNCG